jgi:hypothetical protein
MNNKKSSDYRRPNVAWRDRIWLPLLGRSKASAERATRQYLEDLSSASCFNLLDKALHQLLDGVDDVGNIFSKYATTNSGGKRVWDRGSFARYINARLPENPAMTTCEPLLWRIFSTAAYFPFSAPSSVPEQVSSQELDVDLKAFRRAFAFLVLRGYELFGTMSDGRPFPTSRDKSYHYYTAKVPRLTRIIFQSLSTPSPQPAIQSQAPQELLQLQNVKDTITFTQPAIFPSPHYGRSGVAEEEFEAAAHRLLLTNHGTFGGILYAISKADLHNLIQLFLLQRIEDRRWRNGLSYHDLYQRSGDIQFSHFAPGLYEASRASEFASSFLSSQFRGNEDSITWKAFEAWCSECVSISRRFP